MRFVKDGANIPDELIRSVSRGDVVFFCGAGASMHAGFPNFETLTEGIYSEINAIKAEGVETWASERKEFDRVLGALEKRMPSMRSRIRGAIANLLDPSAATSLDFHLDLLYLSRDSDDRPRLITTNFDTLFERAAEKGRLENSLLFNYVPSYACKDIPKPGSSEDFGIMHLHGRIKDENCECGASKLVLTSADFGDAYLREGWASQYIEDRMRVNTMILVGYAAEDTVLRLFFEAMDANKERFKDLKDIYSINIQTKNSKSIWESKGVIPIEFKCCKLIYKTIRKWKEYMQNPTEYGRKRIFSIFGINDVLDQLQPSISDGSNANRKEPKDISEFEHEQLQFFLPQKDLASTLLLTNASIAWIAWLAKKKIDIHGKVLAKWIFLNCHSAETVYYTSANIDYINKQLDANSVNLLEKHLNEKDDLPSILNDCWRLIIKSMRASLQKDCFKWSEIQDRVVACDQSNEVIEWLAYAIKPKLIVSEQYLLDEASISSSTQVTDLLKITLKVTTDINTYDVIASWPNTMPYETEDRFLFLLTAELEETLSAAEYAGLEKYWKKSITDEDIPSIFELKRFYSRKGFQPIVSVTVTVWNCLASKNLRLALKHINNWSQSRFHLIRRLAIFASINRKVPCDIALNSLVNLHQGDIYFSSAAVEAHNLLCERWNEFTDEQHAQIEKCIMASLPEDWYKKIASYHRQQPDYLIERSRHNLIANLEKAGVVFSKKIMNIRKQFENKWPDLNLQPVGNVGFVIGKVSVSSGDAKKLIDVADENLVSEAVKLAQNEKFGYADWKKLCSENPKKALRGIEISAESSQLPETILQYFLWSVGKQNDSRLVQKVTHLLLKTPGNSFNQMVNSITGWLYDNFGLTGDQGWLLWDKSVDSQICQAEASNDTCYREELNEAIGKFADILIMELEKVKHECELPNQICIRLERLVNADGKVGQLARTRFATKVAFFYKQIPNWTTENILPLFCWSSSDAKDVWSARIYSCCIGTEKLFELLKKPFFQLFEKKDIDNQVIQKYAEWITAIMLNNQTEKTSYSLSSTEARALLQKSGTAGMHGVVRILSKELQETETNQKAMIWRQVVGHVFRGVWPSDSKLQSSQLTSCLVELLLETEEAFPEATEEVLPFIRSNYHDKSTLMHYISDASEIYYAMFPMMLLKLVEIVIGEVPDNSVLSLNEVLERLKKHTPDIVTSIKFQKLHEKAYIIKN